VIELVPYLILPLCALLAVAVIALLQRGEELDDQGLLMAFVAVFSMSLLGCYGLLQTQWLLFKLDPRLQQVAVLQAHPVMQVLERYYVGGNQPLIDAMLAEVAAGTAIPEAMQKARPALALLGRDRLGFADEQARIAWGQAELQALRELKQHGVSQCAALAGSQSDRKGLLVLGSQLSTTYSEQFQQAFVAVLTTADAGMSRQGTPPSANIDLQQLQARYRELRVPLVQQYGMAVVDYLERRRFETMAPFADEQVLCDFRIAQLAAILKEPPAMASRMLDSTLR
jgi:hypothetical protein